MEKYERKVFERGFYHLGADVWIINSDNKILIQKRSSLKRLEPNVWAMTGGSVIVGENSLETIVREAKEELNIDIEKGSAYYEVITEYYVPYDKVDTSEDKIEVSVEANESVKVNEVLQAKIRLINRSDESIYNGMVTINIPQGFTVQEESLMRLESRDIIEKYEISYTSVNLYLSDFEKSRIFNLDIDFRAAYPVDITGLAVRAYDYYNPEIEGKAKPIHIVVSE